LNHEKGATMTEMSAIDWAKRPLQRYANFGGRASRAEFWWFTLAVLIVYIVITILLVMAVGAAATESGSRLGLFGAVGIFILLFWVALLVPTVAVQVRRVHDINRSGWWVGGFYLIYLFYLAAVVGAGSLTASGDAGGGVWVLAVALIMMVYSIVLLVFYCLPGTRGENRFGADPYGFNE